MPLVSRLDALEDVVLVFLSSETVSGGEVEVLGAEGLPARVLGEVREGLVVRLGPVRFVRRPLLLREPGPYVERDRYLLIRDAGVAPVDCTD